VALAMSALLICLIIATCSCDGRDHPAVLPTSWPLTYLSLPPQSFRSAIGLEYGNEHSVDGVSGDQGTQEECRLWMVAFRCSADWDVVRSHVWDSISEHGFLPLHEYAGVGQAYISVDGFTEVRLFSYGEPQYVLSVRSFVYEQTERLRDAERLRKPGNTD
jgi:hypothetical protein